MTRVVIIGGGITGLGAAWALRQTPNPPEIILLEQSDRLGGCIHTEQFNGFLMEHGPDVFLARKPEAIQLCKALGLALQETNKDQRGAYLRRGRRLYPVPEGMSGLVPGRLWPLLSSPLISLRGKLRVLAEFLLPPRTDETDESIQDFFIRRFGPEAFFGLIEPLLGGLAGGRADELSMKALLPHMMNLESKYGSVLLGVGRIPVQEPISPLLSLPDGLSSLITALTTVNEDNIHFGHKATAITKIGTHWKVSTTGHAPLSATDIILAVPAQNAAAVTQSAIPELAELLHQIPYRAGTMVHLAYSQTDVPRPLRGYGHLVASDQVTSVAACTWSAIKLAGRAPAGHLLFRLYLRDTKMTDTVILAQACEEMEQALGITADPLFTRIHRFPAALPQYTLGHVGRIKKIREITSSHSGLYLAGNYLDGVGIPDCIRNGIHAADQIISRHETVS
ncbi:MAG: protoporphyrinogen oxidase [Bacteroidota bacterium]|nr:protoporphyrinogen oxidase [Bacteroidota bacterium]MXW13546.1 protoporphyrinogen oxidase [Rhodothermaceae bacterium]MCY3628453.1 protoporphyrinogen oxidase [Bacteroidota bacterium]MDE2646548.1 protoporphyrinogen oxidase [Bacteroidota bacterium]MXW32955.1 protoporphyrinogen oxidase [Rhodothermaceae bacterium]